MAEFLDQEYYNNSIRDYLIVLSTILGCVLLLKIIKGVLVRKLFNLTTRTSGTLDDFIIRNIERFALPVVFMLISYYAISSLTLSDWWQLVLNNAVTVVVTYFILRFLSSLILKILEDRIRHREKGETKIKQLGGLMLVINIVIWVVGIVFVLDNMGKDVTAIVTGLGIGGIAIALAAQNILGDLFNYFVIYFDRPFEVGDFIVVDDKMGTVEYLGIKTSRIRSLSGEEIIIGNSNLAGARIHNFKRMMERRVVFTLNIDYRTPIEKLKLLPDIIKLIVTEQPLTRFDRCHFASYGDWSLRYETVYMVLTPDYNKFMDIQQEINFKIATALKDQEIYMVTGFHMSLSPPVAQPLSAEKMEEGVKAESKDRQAAQ